MENKDDILLRLNQLEKEESKKQKEIETEKVTNENRKQSKQDEIDTLKDSDKESHKKLEIVTGNGDLDISPVREHLEVEKPKPKENREILIPEVKGNSSNTKNEATENSNDEN